MARPIDLQEAARLHALGLTRKEIASRMRVDRTRLEKAIKHLPRAPYKTPPRLSERLKRLRDERIQAARVRYALICEEAKKGDRSLGALARDFECDNKTIWRALKTDKEARRCVDLANKTHPFRRPRETPPIEVPAWVPDRLHETYRLIGEEDGEEAAAAYCRRAKREAVSSCF